MKILIDMNLSREWVDIFRSQGWQAVHWSSIGVPDDRDEIIMAWAVANQYLVFTHDLDFSAILASTKAPAPSVIQLRIQNIMPESLAATVIAAIHQFENLLEQGVLITVDHGKQRARILPLP
ncbi:MAG: hypothetical protein DYG89_32840 [Caldilinea sp. CFX5]|nr:hypothetical protein [Caldilinea sp. CFX5]